ncbi:hypothetical protein BDD43_1476 [Mucilaginibacter gracilis]|jgi:hypothetical protein|uniref:Uncharacterized protein n=1 Tax=Mucilaginibacter gracilis TaxID=423350 RepID=A0A495IY75_9SPHI|nr:DUF2683 family protein [Mucilaginibacter gracilis]RKR81331.1 hypothetical protein BDD43_1476 [Mucilaginibacter gracilis]
MELLLKNVQKKHLTLIAELAKTLNIDVEKDPYDPAFVAKILKGDQDMKEGKGVKINIDDLWK